MDEGWWIPVDDDGRLRWDEAELLEDQPDLVGRASGRHGLSRAAPARLGDEVARAERDFVAWRARRPVEVLANRELKLAAASRARVERPSSGAVSRSPTGRTTPPRSGRARVTRRG